MKSTWHRDELISLLSISGTLAGFSITAITLFHTFAKNAGVNTIADDVLAVSALLFLLCTYTIFLCLRTQHQMRAVLLEKIADGLFLFAITGMVASGFVMVYTLW